MTQNVIRAVHLSKWYLKRKEDKAREKDAVSTQRQGHGKMKTKPPQVANYSIGADEPQVANYI